MFSVQFFCTLLIADSLDLTGQTNFFEFHILQSVHYNSVITIQTNERTQFFFLITILLQHTGSYMLRALLAHHRGAHNFTKQFV